MKIFETSPCISIISIMYLVIHSSNHLYSNVLKEKRTSANENRNEKFYIGFNEIDLQHKTKSYSIDFSYVDQHERASSRTNEREVEIDQNMSKYIFNWEEGRNKY